MVCQCSPQPPIKDGFCTECQQPVACLPELTPEQQAKMKQCGNCDADQANLCDDCPCLLSGTALIAINPQEVTRIEHAYGVSGFMPRRSESFPILPMGHTYREPEPVLHDRPKPDESARDHARRLLRLGSKTNNALEILAVIPETLALLERQYRRAPSLTEKQRNEQITQHPFLQYITHLLRIRLIPQADSSYPQCERYMEAIAQV